ncbi:MAG TPA: HAD-IB family phosphatase [Patescibacteria group bacterium]|nr:HAD-IB family phosphatase [Patescibacteria group bacterium]
MRWPPFQHIFFDCDSTLTTVEGIDALADAAGKGWRVSVLTEAAMNGQLDLEEVYAKRLEAVRPTRGQIRAIRQIYKQNIVPDSVETIGAMQHLGLQVYIVSGGLAEPVIEFGNYLGIPRQNIRGVGIEYDQLSGEWWQQVDEEQNPNEQFMTYNDDPLVVSDGKALIIQEFLRNTTGRSLLIGDGVSDLLASHAVDLFVGFGGITSRPKVRAESPLFIKSPTLAPLLAIALGPAGLLGLVQTDFHQISETSIQLILDGALEFQSEKLKDKFDKAWNAAYPTLHSGSN